MSRPTERFLPVEILNFAGLNTAVDPENIEDSELSEALNIIYRDDGNVVKRTGFQAHTPQAGDRIHKPIGISRANATDDKLVVAVSEDGTADWADHNFNIYYTTDGINWTELQKAGGTSIDDFVGQAIYYQGLLFIPTVTDIYKYDHADATMPAMTGTRGAFQLAVVQDRIFAIYPTVESRITFTDVGDIDTIPTDNFVEVSKGDGWPITAILPYKDKLVIFKPNAIWVLFLSGTPANWQLRQFADDIGCYGQESCIIVEDIIYFIGLRGVYKTNLSSLEEISVPIRNKFRFRKYPARSSEFRVINRDSIGSWGNELICSMDVSFEGLPAHLMFAYNIVSEKWSEWVPTVTSDDNAFSPPSAFIPLRESQGDLELGLWFGTQELNGKILRYIDHGNHAAGETYKDDGNYYDAEIHTKAFTLNSKAMYKKLPYLYLYLVDTNDTEIRITHAVDLEDYAEIIEFLPVVATSFRSLKVKGPNYFRRYICKIKVIGADEYFEMSSLALMTRYKPLISERVNG